MYENIPIYYSIFHELGRVGKQIGQDDQMLPLSYLYLVMVAGSHIFRRKVLDTLKPETQLIITMMLLKTEPLVIITYKAEKMFLFLPNALFIENRPKFTSEQSILGKLKRDKVNLLHVNVFLGSI